MADTPQGDAADLQAIIDRETALYLLAIAQQRAQFLHTLHTIQLDVEHFLRDQLRAHANAVWLVGFQSDHALAFVVGVYDCESLAIEACATDRHFVARVDRNRPISFSGWQYGLRFPGRGDELAPSDPGPNG
jgi:hypothetical protein